MALCCLLSPAPAIAAGSSPSPATDHILDADRASGAHACYVVDLPALASPLQIHDKWVPFLAEVSARSGVCLRARASRDFSEADARLERGDSDLAVAIPSTLRRIHAHIPYEPIVVSQTHRIRGVLLVPSDSPVRQLADLQEVHLGVPAVDALLTSLLLQDALRRERVRCRIVPLGTPANVMRAVLMGRVAAGGAIDRFLEDHRLEMREQLRVIHTTGSYLAPPLVAHPRVLVETRAAVRAAILGMSADARGRLLLERVHLVDPVPISFADYRAEPDSDPARLSRCAGWQ